MRKVLGLVPVCVVLVQTSAHAGTPLDKQSFTATPAELVNVAKAVPAGDWPAVVLRDEHEITFDAGGKKVRRWRYVFVVRNQSGIDDWGTLSWSWSPFYQDRPTVRARVIQPDGSTSELDASTISDAPAVEKSASVFSDRRALSAPLPRLQIGSVVEEEIVQADRQPIVGTFGATTVYPGAWVPTSSTRITLSAPAALKARQVSRGIDPKIKPRHETKGGRETWAFEIGPLAAHDELEVSVPGDVVVQPEIAITTAPSWAAVSAAYRRVLDQRIADGPFALPADLPKSVTAIVAWLHQQIRYTGIEYGEASNVPWPPAETVKRGFGDCKDKATLLVSLLRQAGIRADLALLSTGPGEDIDPKLPGLGLFDHAIVRAKLGTKEMWIDATEDLLAPGRLPPRDQGRRALIIADDTVDLVTTPRTGGDAMREVRTFEASEDGTAKITEVTSASGTFGAYERDWIRGTRADDVRKDLAKYMTSEYVAKTLDHYSTSAPGTDLDKPFEMTTVATDSGRVFTSRDHLDIYLFPADTIERLPGWLKAKPGAGDKPRKLDYEWSVPHTYEIESRIVLPPGFAPPAPEPAQTTKLGTASLTRERKVDGQTLIVSYRFDTGKPRLAPNEFEELRTALRTVADEKVHIVIAHRAWAAIEKGDVKGAIAEAERLIKLHPNEARHHEELATMYLLTGAGKAARREAAKATQVEPKAGDAFAMQAWILRHDTFGDDYGFDFDRAGALAGYTKARALTPDHVGAAEELADIIGRGADGKVSWTPADLAAAVQAWKVAHTVTDEKVVTASLVRALLRAGRASEAEPLARTIPASDEHDTLLVAATAAGNPASAISLASSMRSGSERNTLLKDAGRELVVARLYPAALPLLVESGMLRDGTIEGTAFKRIARHDEKVVLGNDPKLVIPELLISRLDPKHETQLFLDDDTRADFVHPKASSRSSFGTMNRLAPALMLDMMLSAVDAKVEGAAAGPWRISSEVLGEKLIVYAASIGGRAKLLGAPDTPYGVAQFALQRIVAKDVATARRVMDWLVADAAHTPGAKISALWGSSVPNDDKALAVAAAAFSFGRDRRAIPILVACESGAPGARSMCDGSLALAYWNVKQWRELVEHTTAWEAREPTAKAAQWFHVRALREMKRFDEADALVAKMLAKDPDNHDALSLHPTIAVARGDTEEAVKRYEALVKSAGAKATDKNSYAWYLAGNHRDLPLALELSRAAVREVPTNGEFVNTLSAVEAEVGDLRAAIKDTLRSMELRRKDVPEAGDWYVVGRIEEQLGLKADAIASYKRIKREDSVAFDSKELAAARLRALGAAK